jgi:hypothetical protein
MSQDDQLGTLLQHLSETDPALSQRMQLIQQVMSMGNAGSEHHDPEEAPRGNLPRRVRRLIRHVQHLERRCDMLAEALGACPCWGDDPDCEDCEGKGTPGAFEPDPSLFREFVGALLTRQPYLVLPFVERKRGPPPRGSARGVRRARGTGSVELVEQPMVGSSGSATKPFNETEVVESN